MKISKSRFIVLCFMMVIISTLYVFADDAIHAAKNKFPILFNGEQVDVEAYNINERTYLNLRDMGALTGTEIDFNDDYEIIINSGQLADDNNGSNDSMISKVKSVCKVYVDKDDDMNTPIDNNGNPIGDGYEITGSGVFISSNKILTCKHLITEQIFGTTIPDVRVKIKIGGTVANATIQSISNSKDLALLKVNYENDNYVEFTNVSHEEGDVAITISNPYGVESQINLGEYDEYTYANAGYLGAYIGDNYYKTTNAVAGGSSGGLLMDGDYNCYGIVAIQDFDGTLSVNTKNINNFLGN